MLLPSKSQNENNLSHVCTIMVPALQKLCNIVFINLQCFQHTERPLKVPVFP